MKFSLYSRVALAVDLPAEGIRRGDVATIVDHHPAPSADGGEPGYSLEVFTALGDTFAVVTVPESHLEALRRDEELKPDVVVLDIALPGISGIEILRRILARRPGACVLMFSMYQDGIYATRSINAGARGYLSKASAPDLLVQAVRTVAQGRRYVSPDIEQVLAQSSTPNGLADTLSARELEVLRMLSQGYSVEKIGERLGLSPKTAANHQSSIKQKLGADSALQLILIAQQLGLISQQ